MSPLPYLDVPVAELAALPAGTRRIDVREPDEWTGPLGHLPQTELVPLATVGTAASSWKRAEPLLLICRSGNRSGKAALLLSSMGFTTLFNLQGGMIAVREAEKSMGSAP